MDDDDFINIISRCFAEIKSQFRVQITRLGLAFNDDIFSDTIIKCNNNLKGKTMTNKEMINYFWAAFKNNTLRDLNYFRNKGTDVFPEYLLDDDSVTSDIFNEISDMIIKKFGADMYRLFALHANGATYEDLSKITDITNLKYKFRCVRDFVRNNYKF